MSTYDKNLPELMTRRGILDEILPPNFAKPKNLLAIQNAILGSPSSSDTITPSEEEISDYSVYCQIISTAGILENDLAARAFQPFLTSLYSYWSLIFEVVSSNGEIRLSQKSSRGPNRTTSKD